MPIAERGGRRTRIASSAARASGVSVGDMFVRVRLADVDVDKEHYLPWSVGKCGVRGKPCIILSVGRASSHGGAAVGDLLIDSKWTLSGAPSLRDLAISDEWLHSAECYGA